MPAKTALKKISPEEKNDRQAVTILKGLAIVAVVLIHVLSSIPGHIYYLPETQWWSVFLDQLSRFSVPAFILLSGYALTQKYENSVLQLKEFIQRRVLKLLPLYLFWSLVLTAVFMFEPQWRPSSPITSFPERLFFGSVDYHLYFVPLILQLYLLFPLLLFFLKKQKWLLLAASLGVQVAALWWYRQIVVEQPLSYMATDQGQYILFFTWIFYFVLGMVLAVKSQWFYKNWWFKAVMLVLAAYTLRSAINEGLAILHKGYNAITVMRFTRFIILAYGTTSVLAAFGLILEWLKSPLLVTALWPLQKLLLWLGKYSYVIFLSHTLVLRIYFGWSASSIETSTLVVSSMAVIGGLWMSHTYLGER